MNTNQTIGRRIREKREELGLTQAALARKMNITPSKISAVENGRFPLTISGLYEFCQQFACKPANIISI